MKAPKMNKPLLDSSQAKAARLSGFMFLLALIVPTLNWAFVLSGFKDADNALDTVKNIMANETIFRMGLAIELFMSVSLVILGWALYNLLKPINNKLALLALLLKLAEATLMAVTVLIPFIALQAYSGEAANNPLGLIFNSHTAITSIPMVFLGMDMMLFSYLFFKSRYIPRLLAGFGILSFALIFIHALMYVLRPDYAALSINQLIFWTPSGLFELIIGSWLLLHYRKSVQ